MLNRATFDDKQVRHKVIVQPFQYENAGTLDLGGMANVLWVKHIKWVYEYKDVQVPNARKTPVKPIRVTVADILQDEDSAYPPFNRPKPVVGKVPFRVINTNIENNHQLIVTFHIDGILVTPKDGPHDPVTLKEMMAWIMMGAEEQGRLAMAEAVTDKLDAKFAQLGLGSLREKFPSGLGALSALPGPMQNIVMQAMAQNGDLPPALTGMIQAPNNNPLQLAMDADPAKEESAFIGDLIATCPDELSLSKKELQEIAGAMIERGWRKV